jgi:hypothetical protein
MRFPQYVSGSPISYSENFARWSHKGQFRDTGGLVFDKHCVPVSKKIAELVPKGHPRHEPARIIGLTHDSPEDKAGIEVYDKFSSTPFIPPGKILMNFLYANYEKGDEVCYGVNKLTHRKWLPENHPHYKTYPEYISDICSFSYNEEELRQYDTILALAKNVDLFFNINPEELELIIKLEESGERSLQRRVDLENKLRDKADDYLTTNGPKIEIFTMYESRKEHGENFWNWNKIKEHLAETRERAILLSRYHLKEIVSTEENMNAFRIFGKDAILYNIYKERYDLIENKIEEARKKIK